MTLDLRSAKLRASPGYELVVADRLPEAEWAALAALGPGTELYGLLRPRAGTTLDPRAVSHDTALLFLTLEQPGPLPAYALRQAGEEEIVRLVLDGVLEIQHRGLFRGGADAHELLLPSVDTTRGGRTAALSREALRYGQALGAMPVETRAARLYFYGRRPLTATMRHSLPDEAAVSAALGLPLAHADEAWVEEPRAESGVWRVFRRRRGARREHLGGAKLYVSPIPEQTGAALQVVADTLVDCTGAAGFKVARDAAGLCRPDKLVCYFSRLEDLHTAVQVLRPRLNGLEAQGVPFTAPIDDDGVLAWGLDPPEDPSHSSRGESWRLRVVRLAAEALELAHAESPGTREPWQRALDRLRLAGIDPETWVPDARVWA